jgi:hypothetical protein
MDNVINAMWQCTCCGDDIAMSAGGLCRTCAAVVARLRVEQAMDDDIGGQSRRDLARLYIEAHS